jgi:hypothetical protein
MAKQPQKLVTRESLRDDDLRSELLSNNMDFADFENSAVGRDQVNDGKIFGLNPVERMILSIVLFLAVTVLGLALLFFTGTIAIR